MLTPHCLQSGIIGFVIMLPAVLRGPRVKHHGHDVVGLKGAGLSGYQREVWHCLQWEGTRQWSCVTIAMLHIALNAPRALLQMSAQLSYFKSQTAEKGSIVSDCFRALL